MGSRFIRSLVVALCLAAPGTAGAQSFVYLLGNTCDRSGLTCSPFITLVDATTGTRVTTYDVGFHSFAGSLRISSDGKRLYVLHNSSLSILDTATRKRVGGVSSGLGFATVDVAVLPDGSRAYISNNNGVGVVDLTTMTVVTTIQVGTSPGRIVGSPDGSAIYVANTGSNTVSRIATATNSVTATIPVGQLPAALDMSPDGSRLFVANADSASISVVDPASDSTVRTIPAGSSANRPGTIPADSIGYRPRAVTAPSASQVFTALDSFGFAPPKDTIQLLDANDGTVLGETALESVSNASRFVRDSSGGSIFLVGARLWRLSADGQSAVDLGTGAWHAAVLEGDPCAFAGSSSPSVFGPPGGRGTLTIPAPAGCAWSFDASAFPGVTFDQAPSGTGPASLTFTMAAGSRPRYGSTRVGLGDVSIEQTIPAMNVDFASGQTLPQPVTIGGWAIDQNAAPSGGSGVDRLDVWAYPASGAAPMFLGNPTLGTDRPDIAATFGDTRYRRSGFTMLVSGLGPGAYTVVFYAHSSRSNLFSSAQSVTITLLPAGPPQGLIDSPSPSGHVQPAFRIVGWAVDPAGSSAARPSGVAAVDIHAYPDGGGSPIPIGSTFTSRQRLDIAAYLGPPFLFSGYAFDCAALPPGSYTLAVFAHRNGSTAYTPYTTRITVDPATPIVTIDTPAAGSIVPRQFSVGGWALEQSTCSGSGVDVIHIWAYSLAGSAPIFLGSQTVFSFRSDVSAIFGFRYFRTGYSVPATLPAGTYDIAVFARTTATKTFSPAKVVRVIVQE
jgi:YVTN family beta-propeller protein